MREPRMPKGWKFIATTDLAFGNTETKASRFKKDLLFRNMMRTATSLSIEKINEESEALYEKMQEDNRKLLQAFADKKLKSKTAIKKAKALISK